MDCLNQRLERCPSTSDSMHGAISDRQNILVDHAKQLGGIPQAVDGIIFYVSQFKSISKSSVVYYRQALLKSIC